MLLAASYHAVGVVLEGCPFVIVATAFWICRSRPFLNLTTKVFGSVYPDSTIKLIIINRSSPLIISCRFQLVNGGGLRSGSDRNEK